MFHEFAYVLAVPEAELVIEQIGHLDLNFTQKFDLLPASQNLVESYHTD